MSNSKTTTNGIGFSCLLTIAFIVLKLTNYIDWNWWWVLCPLWIGVAIVIAVLLILGIVVLLGGVFKK